MEATTAGRGTRAGWLAALLPLILLGALIGFFVALDAPGLERNGVPVEEVAIERTELRPNEIELQVRNDGPDSVQIAQAIVNDAFAGFQQDDDELGRLDQSRLTIDYPWIEGEAYEVVLLTSTGGTVDTSIDVAAETPEADSGFYGLMGLIGLYVGIIPVAIGMLWLPWMRRLDRRWLRFLLALTVGLLVFLGIDAALEGLELGASGAESLGGGGLMWLGAALAYLALAGVDGWLERRRGGGGERVALLVAIGIGLHNLGEGLVIGSAYAVGSLALGAALVVGFAIHNTTEGLAIVAPVADLKPSLAALMFGLGVGAIARVVVQIAPQIRDGAGRLLHPLAAAGLAAGLTLMYVTGLLISV